MSAEVNLFSFVITSIVGTGCGALVGFGLKWPKSVAWIIVIAILAGFSPWIMTSGWLIGSHDDSGNMTGVHLGYWLTFFCATVIVAFGLRLMKSNRVVAG